MELLLPTCVEAGSKAASLHAILILTLLHVDFRCFLKHSAEAINAQRTSSDSKACNCAHLQKASCELPRGSKISQIFEPLGKARGSKISEIFGTTARPKISKIFGRAALASGAVFRVIYLSFTICAAALQNAYTRRRSNIFQNLQAGRVCPREFLRSPESPRR